MISDWSLFQVVRCLYSTWWNNFDSKYDIWSTLGISFINSVWISIEEIPLNQCHFDCKFFFKDTASLNICCRRYLMCYAYLHIFSKLDVELNLPLICFRDNFEEKIFHCKSINPPYKKSYWSNSCYYFWLTFWLKSLSYHPLLFHPPPPQPPIQPDVFPKQANFLIRR